jgi:hypothetical protein
MQIRVVGIPGMEKGRKANKDIIQEYVPKLKAWISRLKKSTCFQE